MNKDIIVESIKHYGKSIQLTVAMEECSELIQAVSKEIRGKHDKAHLSEEIADVLISIEIIKQACGVTESEVNEWIDYKQERIKRRIVATKAEAADTQADINKAIDEAGDSKDNSICRCCKYSSRHKSKEPCLSCTDMCGYKDKKCKECFYYMKGMFNEPCASCNKTDNKGCFVLAENKR